MYDAARKALTAVLENQGLRPTTLVALVDGILGQMSPF